MVWTELNAGRTKVDQFPASHGVEPERTLLEI